MSSPYLVSSVMHGLAVGPMPPLDVRTLHPVRKLVLCAAEWQPPAWCYPGVSVVRALLDDSGKRMLNAEREAARRAARSVVRSMRRGELVLVTCAMGFNRSCLVAALAMLELDPHWDVDDVLARLRRARGPRALSNRDFVDFLRLEAEWRAAAAAV